MRLNRGQILFFSSQSGICTIVWKEILANNNIAIWRTWFQWELQIHSQSIQ